MSGGQCPKYDAVSAAGEKLPKDAPNPYRERDELLQALLDEETGTGRTPATRRRGGVTAGPLVGLPYAHYLIDTLPFFHTLLRRLGYRVEVLRPGRDTLAEGDRRCAAPGACAPVKLLHGLAGADVDVFFAPIFVHLPLPNAGARTYTCPMAQGAPDMVGRALQAEGSPHARAAARCCSRGRATGSTRRASRRSRRAGACARLADGAGDARR